MEYWGYEWEAIKVPTEDGYILTTFHLTGKKGHDIKKEESYMPVMLMHGLGCDATSWLDPNNRVERPLPMQLFDDGFDVWMASNRGTKYCQEHNEYSVDQKEFWDFSWAEMGLYDDVDNIKKIKELSGKEKVSYVGVS